MNKKNIIFVLLFLLIILVGCQNKTVTVTFDTNGGDPKSNVELESGSKLNPNITATNEGYALDYWEKDGEEFDLSEPIKRDMTLTAIWTNGYTVTFDTNGGTEINPVTVKDGGTIIIPTVVKEGYNLWHWSLNGYEFNEDSVVTSDITLVAKWITDDSEIYSMSFDATGGTNVNDILFVGDQAIKDLPMPVLDGYVFTGWFLFGNEVMPDATFSRNVSVQAGWMADNGESYTVNFYDNTGSIAKSETVYIGSDATAPDFDEVAGQAFEGWSEAYNNVSKNLDIYPEYRVFTYDVVFMSDEEEVSVQVIEYGSDATAPFMANSEGKYFAGWDADYTNVKSDLTLFATWKDNIAELDDSEVCAATYNNLLSIIPETAKDQIELPTTDDETGVAIAWESSNHQIIRSTGKIVPDTENRVITLTANMIYGDYTCEYTFEVKVSRYYVDTTKGISAGYFYLTSNPISQDALDTLDIFIMAFGSVSASGATSPGSAALYFVNNYLEEIHENGGYVVISFINPDSFSSFASTAAGRANFAASCVKMLNLYDIDGIDIDWETKVSTENYTLMIKELNRQIKANNESHLVISTVGGGPWAPNKFDTSAYADDVDLINLMTYGMQIGYSRHQGALYEGTGTYAGCSVDASVKFYERKGTPLNKLVVGIAFFGEQYDGSGGLSNGGTGLDSKPSAKTYSYIASNYLNKEDKQTSIFFDNQCGVPYVYDSGTGVFITYEDSQSIQLKCQYVASNKLAGVMFWQYSQDNGDLISAISEYQSLYK